MYKYTFTDGHSITSNLSAEDVLARMDRLSALMGAIESYESGYGLSIYNKAFAAYNKITNFTGIIRLSIHEKDFLGYIVEDNEFISDEVKRVLNYYMKY